MVIGIGLIRVWHEYRFSCGHIFPVAIRVTIAIVPQSVGFIEIAEVAEDSGHEVRCDWARKGGGAYLTGSKTVLIFSGPMNFLRRGRDVTPGVRLATSPGVFSCVPQLLKDDFPMVTSDLGACEWFVWDLRRSGLIDRGQLDQIVRDRKSTRLNSSHRT